MRKNHGSCLNSLSTSQLPGGQSLCSSGHRIWGQGNGFHDPWRVFPCHVPSPTPEAWSIHDSSTSMLELGVGESWHILSCAGNPCGFDTCHFRRLQHELWFQALVVTMWFSINHQSREILCISWWTPTWPLGSSLFIFDGWVSYMNGDIILFNKYHTVNTCKYQTPTMKAPNICWTLRGRIQLWFVEIANQQFASKPISATGCKRLICALKICFS